MATRKDRKGRILRRGEGQKPDGRYYFKYKDAKGKTRYKYSWTLTESDFPPRGKKPGPCLREIEKQVQRDLSDRVAPGDMSVVKLVEEYVSTKTAVRPTTKAGYRTVIGFLARDEFGGRRISDITTLDAKNWLIHLQQDLGKSFSSIHSIRGVLRPAFQLAEEDDIIRRNPFNFELTTVLFNDSVRRDALTAEQERRFLEFVRADEYFSRYYKTFYILFNTGLRISEFCGLTLDDLDFEKGSIRVNKQLQRTSDMRYYVERPKTGSGERYIPMTREVERCFKRLIDRRPSFEDEPTVDGVCGFLCFDKNGRPKVALHWEKYFQHVAKKYGRIREDELPKITPHVCRHTFCSKMAKNGMNPAKLKYIMGHADISVTLNTYTHVGFADIRHDMLEISDNLL